MGPDNRLVYFIEAVENTTTVDTPQTTICAPSSLIAANKVRLPARLVPRLACALSLHTSSLPHIVLHSATAQCPAQRSPTAHPHSDPALRNHTAPCTAQSHCAVRSPSAQPVSILHGATAQRHRTALCTGQRYSAQHDACAHSPAHHNNIAQQHSAEHSATAQLVNITTQLHSAQRGVAAQRPA
jgi:hypothetical protein